MTTFTVPKPAAIVKAVRSGSPGLPFSALAREAGAYHERIRAWRVEQRAAGKSQDYIDAKSNDYTYLLNEALEAAGKQLDDIAARPSSRDRGVDAGGDGRVYQLRDGKMTMVTG